MPRSAAEDLAAGTRECATSFKGAKWFACRKAAALSGHLPCYSASVNPRRCTICASPPEVCVLIERGLANKVFLRVLAAQSGLSRSAIDRHKQKCIPRKVLNTFRDKKRSAQNERLISVWPDGSMKSLHDPLNLDDGGRRISRAELRGGDALVLIKVDGSAVVVLPSKTGQAR